MALAQEEQRIFDDLRARVEALEVHVGLREAPPVVEEAPASAAVPADDETKALLRQLLAKLG